MRRISLLFPPTASDTAINLVLQTSSDDHYFYAFEFTTYSVNGNFKHNPLLHLRFHVASV